ncbi:hypothetical protein IWW50_005211 [Coemansia erecta]|nr:hypothetical protein IWW50_005211 [Coemansia erecta]
MSCSVAPSTRAQPSNSRHRSDSEPVSRGFDELSPAEREQSLAEIEVDFRRYVAENRTRTGFAFYPNSRQITKGISTLYQSLAGIDFSDAFDECL